MKIWIAVSACVVTAAFANFAPQMNTAAVAKPSGIFQKLSGTWRGSGRITLAGGNSQKINCRAYYNVKDSGSGLGFAIRCASPDNKIELRARIQDSNGRLSGTWEERTFNATGQVSGSVSRSLVNLKINGAVSGSVRISYSNSRQKVSISTATESLRGIAINLRR
ncbi:MAG: hypothetical protein JXQ99_07025 [Hyphomicrobiaceae bacterium]